MFPTSLETNRFHGGPANSKLCCDGFVIGSGLLVSHFSHSANIIIGQYRAVIARAGHFLAALCAWPLTTFLNHLMNVLELSPSIKVVWVRAFSTVTAVKHIKSFWNFFVVHEVREAAGAANRSIEREISLPLCPLTCLPKPAITNAFRVRVRSRSILVHFFPEQVPLSFVRIIHNNKTPVASKVKSANSSGNGYNGRKFDGSLFTLFTLATSRPAPI